MRIIERLKSDINKIKEMPDKKKRMSFIWDYYKFLIIGLVSILLLIVIIIGNAIKYKDVAMHIVMINTDSGINEVNDSIFEDVLIKEGYQLNKKRIDINDSMTLGKELHEEEDIATMQVLNALFTISDLDVFVADEETFKRYADVDGYADLSVLIDQDLLEDYQLYKHVNDNNQEVVDGIYLNVDSLLHEAGYYHNPVIVGACINGNNLEEAILFIKGLID